MQERPSGRVVDTGPDSSAMPVHQQGDGGAGAQPPRPSRSTAIRRRILPILTVVVGVVAAGLALRGTLPHPVEVASALRTASVGWLAVAAVAEALSMSMFGRLQRRLLGAFGVPISVSRVEALTYARTALSVTMPAGAVISAGFAYRQYQARGASHRIAASVMVLSGVLSSAGLVIVYGAWIVAVTAARPALAHPGAAVSAIAVVTAGGWAAAHHLSVRRRRDRIAASRTNPARNHKTVVWLAARWPWAGRVATSVLGAIDVARTLRQGDLIAASTFAVANWVGDLACLICVGHAFALTLSVVQVAGAYLAVQIVRQIPITPGGIGLIEASLLVALVAAGAPSVAAAAVVLVYRVLSCWLIAAVGFLVWVALQSTGRREGNTPSRRSTEGR
jgi:uncharacterized protein (TIRG00374 family)